MMYERKEGTKFTYVGGLYGRIEGYLQLLTKSEEIITSKV